MKRVISFCIIAFVFLYVLATGFFIVKTSLTSDFSNAQLIARLVTAKPPSFSTLAFAHLADAASSTETFPPATLISNYSFSKLPPFISSAASDPQSTTSYENLLAAMAATLVQLEAATGSKSQ